MKPLLFLAIAAVANAATPVSDIKVPPGFKVELLREAGQREGSWISMALDAKGRIYISPQGSIPESGMAKGSKWGGLWRSTVVEGKVTAWERVPVPIGDSMGMLWAFDSLYVSGNGPEGRGIYRCKDTDGDSLPDTAVMWKKIPGGSGEHGAHALVLSSDKKNIYIVHGNATGLIDGIAPDSPYRNWGEDDLLPKLKDPTATFFDSIKAPYGYVLRTDEEGKKWELIAGGFRNPYDIDFNADGELFTYDSDMEWDRGLPWYRPTRVLHIVPGGEYGFREGSAKMPAYYPDTLPAAVDIGLGCPTGVKFGTRSHFGEKYRRAFFVCDWTYGRILAVHMKERGASYTATNLLKSTTFPKDAESSADVEPFVVGKGMPVTDVEFLGDGSMVFTTGGRGTSAGLYRVSWVGKKQPVKQGMTPEQLSAVNDALDKISDEIRELENVIFHSLGKAPEQQARVETLKREFAAIVDPKRVRNIGQLVPYRDGFEILRDTEAFGRLSREKQKQEGLRLARSELHGRFIRGIPEKIFQGLVYDFRTLNDEESLQHTTFRLAAIHQRYPKDDIQFQISLKILSSMPPRYALSKLLGYASLISSPQFQQGICEALTDFPLPQLPDDLKLLKLRILQLTFARHGRPSEEWQKLGLEKLLASYPAKGERAADLNRELSQLLVWLSQPELGDANLSGDVNRPKDAPQPPKDSPQPLKDARQPLNEDSQGAKDAVQPLKDIPQPLKDTPQPPKDTVQPPKGAAQPLKDAVQPFNLTLKSTEEVAQKQKDTGISQRDPSKPAPNPGAVEHKGRKGQLFHAELGQQVIEKTLALMQAAPSQEEQIYYALVLRWAHGWTPQQRERYLRWFHEKGARLSGGNSLAGFIRKIHAEAASRVPDAEKVALAKWIVPLTGPAPELITPRAAIKAWTLAELEKELDALKGYKPDLARGKQLYADAQCSRCHLYKDAGGNVGPDLSAVAQRFQRHDILEAITDPNKAVSEQYALTTLTVVGGEQITGIMQEETSGTIRILTDPTKGTSREFYHNIVLKKEKALVSLMPPALLNTMTAEEVADLLAFLGAGGGGKQ